MRKFCVRRNWRNSEAVNQYFNRLYKKRTYSGTGEHEDRDCDYMHYPKVGNKVVLRSPQEGYELLTLEQLNVMKYTIGDYVKTTLGNGHIVKVNNREYLVKLDIPIPICYYDENGDTGTSTKNSRYFTEANIEIICEGYSIY